VVGDQGVQRRDAVDPFGQALTDQPTPLGVSQLDVVMSLSPVISDEQHDLLLAAGRTRTA